MRIRRQARVRPRLALEECFQQGGRTRGVAAGAVRGPVRPGHEEDSAPPPRRASPPVREGRTAAGQPGLAGRGHGRPPGPASHRPHGSNCATTPASRLAIPPLITMVSCGRSRFNRWTRARSRRGAGCRGSPLRRQLLQPRLAGVDDEGRDPGGGAAADQLRTGLSSGSWSSTPRRHFTVTGRRGRLGSSPPRPAPRGPARASGRALNRPLCTRSGGAAHVEVDLVIALASAAGCRLAAAKASGSEPPSWSATGCSAAPEGQQLAPGRHAAPPRWSASSV